MGAAQQAETLTLQQLTIVSLDPPNGSANHLEILGAVTNFIMGPFSFLQNLSLL
jgi:hypothetical protein